jgi:hypothetical protein
MEKRFEVNFKLEDIQPYIDKNERMPFMGYPLKVDTTRIKTILKNPKCSVCGKEVNRMTVDDINGKESIPTLNFYNVDEEGNEVMLCRKYTKKVVRKSPEDSVENTITICSECLREYEIKNNFNPQNGQGVQNPCRFKVGKRYYFSKNSYFNKGNSIQGFLDIKDRVGDKISFYGTYRSLNSTKNHHFNFDRDVILSGTAEKFILFEPETNVTHPKKIITITSMNNRKQFIANGGKIEILEGV